MSKTNTLPFPQTPKIVWAYFTNSDGTRMKNLQSAGADYAGCADDSRITSWIILNNTTATVPTFMFGLLDNTASPIATQSGTLTNGATTCTGLSDTTLLAVGMLISGTGIASGTFISAIGSSTAITLSKNATASGAQTLTFTPVQRIGQVTVPAKSGGDSAGIIANVDLLGSPYVTGLPIDASGRPYIRVAPLTAVAASNGGFDSIAHIEEYTAS